MQYQSPHDCVGRKQNSQCLYVRTPLGKGISCVHLLVHAAFAVEHSLFAALNLPLQTPRVSAFLCVPLQPVEEVSMQVSISARLCWSKTELAVFVRACPPRQGYQLCAFARPCCLCSGAQVVHSTESAPANTTCVSISVRASSASGRSFHAVSISARLCWSKTELAVFVRAYPPRQGYQLCAFARPCCLCSGAQVVHSTESAPANTTCVSVPVRPSSASGRSFHAVSISARLCWSKTELAVFVRAYPPRQGYQLCAIALPFRLCSGAQLVRSTESAPANTTCVSIPVRPSSASGRSFHAVSISARLCWSKTELAVFVRAYPPRQGYQLCAIALPFRLCSGAQLVRSTESAPANTTCVSIPVRPSSASGRSFHAICISARLCWSKTELAVFLRAYPPRQGY
ncbi:uncharacterized protein LOC125944940 isoform X8 [Dermacentor silvarum]|uniref:uncharacterized protein LOC125944940 isoform X8 n=1 Tax=Dermacentor silvarum TaxID=543639 RepID=UPI0021016662|nr:uncharacterized protein LOC125944940 isoform X8 [Dermacentor silvarum]